MEKCSYEHVNQNNTEIEPFSWKYLLRQDKQLSLRNNINVLVSSGVWNIYFMIGFCQGAPTVIIPQLRQEANSTEAVSSEMASWISSFHGYGALPWVVVVPLLSERTGRKYPFFAISFCALASFISLFFCKTAVHILFAEVIQGPVFGCQLTISVIIIAEYTSPKYRGLFLALKSAGFNWGMWVANFLGTFYHWRAIAVAGIVFSFYNILTTLFWCESPYWLAAKHRYEACARSHRWLKGRGEESEKELATLVKSYEECRDVNDKAARNQKYILRRTYKAMKQKAFYKPILLSFGVLSLYHCSGKLICSIYAIDIIKKITSKESTAYNGMMLLDGVTVFGMYIGCGLSKILKRRTLLLGGSCSGIIFLFILSFYLHLTYFSVIVENNIISLGLLTMFFLNISFGPIILASSIYAELVTQRFKSESMIVAGLYVFILQSTALKTAPLIFLTFKLHGAFLFYGILSSILTFLLYKYLPETKDKTLQEIEDFICDKHEVDNTL